MGLHNWRVVTVVAIMAIVAAGCQDTISIGIANDCNEAVEVTWDDRPLGENSPPAQEIRAGRTDRVGVVSVNSDTLYLAVRIDTDPSVREFVVAMNSLSAPRDGLGFDRLLVLSGEDCAPLGP